MNNYELYKEFFELYHKKVSDIVTIKERKKRMLEIKQLIDATLFNTRMIPAMDFYEALTIAEESGLEDEFRLEYNSLKWEYMKLKKEVSDKYIISLALNNIIGRGE